MWLLLAALLAQSADFLAEGTKALNQQKYDAAVELLTKAVAADPKDYGARFNLALAYGLLGKDAEAIPHYKAVLDLKPGLYEAELNLGLSLLHTKDAAGAVPYLTSASVQKPNEFRPALLLADALLQAGTLSAAELAYVRALGLNPASAAAELGLGQARARQGRPGDAEPHFRKAAELDRTYKDAILELARVYESNHQLAETIAIYRDFPDNPGAQERMGALLAETGHAADAIPALEAAVAKSPTSANRLALAQAYAERKQLDKASSLAAQVAAAEPRDIQVRLFYARLLRDQRKYADAAQQFVAAAQLDSGSAKTWSELAAVLVIAEQYPQAVAALDRVRALGGETTGHYYFRAISLDHMHLLKEALESYNKFLASSQGNNPDEEFKARQRVRIIQQELAKR
jgi:tetratricopeptide (TPR) repeat protein